MLLTNDKGKKQIDIRGFHVFVFNHRKLFFLLNNTKTVLYLPNTIYFLKGIVLLVFKDQCHQFLFNLTFTQFLHLKLLNISINIVIYCNTQRRCRSVTNFHFLMTLL